MGNKRSSQMQDIVRAGEPIAIFSRKNDPTRENSGTSIASGIVNRSRIYRLCHINQREARETGVNPGYYDQTAPTSL